MVEMHEPRHPHNEGVRGLLAGKGALTYLLRLRIWLLLRIWHQALHHLHAEGIFKCSLRLCMCIPHLKCSLVLGEATHTWQVKCWVEMWAYRSIACCSGCAPCGAIG